MRLFTTTIGTPVGNMMVLASDETLCALEFVSPKRHVRLDARRRRWFPPHTIEQGETPVIRLTRTWLEEYFADAGEGRLKPAPTSRVPERALKPATNLGDGGRPRVPMNVPPLAMYGTDFEKRVWQALLEIPAGETSTYGAIARKLGVPGASRAVGLANGSNPIAIIVPCHRVIGSSGALIGYGGGLDRKRWLLDHERQWSANRLFA